ncbi:MAG TPA: DUF3341 domain-containing protein [Candidatus Binataceae bacterium]|nr:DUF3341 domain-containing protein [Candidatus Binataceae bacterium]
MNGDIQLVGSFVTDGACAEAIEALHHAKIVSFRTFSPFPSEKIAEAVDEVRGWGRSPVRKFVMAGGFTGALTGLVVTVGTSWEWNINTGGRPIASITPYVVIIFELMILFGVLGAVSSFFFKSGLPAFEQSSGYRTRFGADRFGLVVQAAEGDAAKIEALMRDAGAEEVVREAA